MLQARLFGRLDVALAGRSMPPLAGPRPRSLLAWLLLHPGRHARGSVAARFWPDVLDTSARASLRSALWTVRGALAEIGAEAYLDAGRDVVGIDPDVPREVDVERFRSLGAGGPRERRAALALAAEPLLVDLADEWVLDAREGLRREAAAMALALADDAGAESGTALGWLRRAVELDRLDESLHRRLIRGLADAGEPAGALAAYRRCRDLLAAEFGTPPSAATRELVAEIRSAAREQPPAPAPASAGAIPGPADLVGRDAELAILAEAWRGAAAGAGGVVIVRGVPGIGKTELAREAARRAAGAGALIGFGQASGLAAAAAFGPWSEAIGELATRLAPPDRGASWPSQLARICSPIETHWEHPAGPLAAAPDLARAQLFEALAEMIRWASARTPVMIVLDDLQWADDASVAVLANLGRRASDLPVLIVVTHRPVERDDLSATLAGLRRRGGIRAEIELGGLAGTDLGAVAAQAAPGLAPTQVSAAVELAEGNPLLAIAAGRALAAGRDAAQGLRPWVAEQRHGLAEAARLLVDVVAAAGRALSLDELEPLLAPHDADGALEAATMAQLLEVEGGRGVRFRHDLVRDACYAEIEPARRAMLHRRLAEALRERPRARIGEVARHLVLAGNGEAARGYLEVAAARARSIGAFGEAAAFLREAAQAADHPHLAAEIWLRVAEVEAWRGNRAAHDAAFATADELLATAPEPALRAEALALRGRCLRSTLCYPSESGDAYRAALAEIDAAADDLPELRAICTAGLAWSEAQVGDVERAEALIAEAHELSRGDDPVMALELAIDRATALMRRGDFAAGEAQVLAGAALEGVGDQPELIQAALSFAATAAAARGDFAAVLDLAERGLRAGRTGFALEAELVAARAYALSRMGRHDEALAVVAVLMRGAAATGQLDHEAAAAFDAAQIAIAAGRPAEAVDHLQRALADGVERLPRALARLRLAGARAAAGDPDAAQAELERFAFEPVRPADAPAALIPRLAAVEGLIAVARGQFELAVERLSQAAGAWRRLSAGSATEGVVGMVDLGRAPVAGLVEPRLELGRVCAELAGAHLAAGELEAARRAAVEGAECAAASGDRETAERLSGIHEAIIMGGTNAGSRA